MTEFIEETRNIEEVKEEKHKKMMRLRQSWNWKNIFSEFIFGV